MPRNQPVPRILLLNHNSRGIGTFFRCWHLAHELALLGFEATLVTVSASRRVLPSSTSNDGFRVIDTPNLLTYLYALGSGYGVLGIPYRILLALRRNFDLVHAFDHKPSVLFPAVFRKRLKNTPLVADWCDWWGTTRDGSGLQETKGRVVAKVEASMEAYIHREADWVTAISTGLRERAISLGIPPGRVSLIPSGAPIEAIRPLDKEGCRAQLGISPSVFLLGYVGVGIRDLDVMAPALKEAVQKRVRFRLAALGVDEVPDRSLRDIVVPMGHIPFSNLPEYLGACDAFVLPMRDTVFNQTRWPNKFGDYIAAGRPVLCSAVGDVPSYVERAQCGLLWRDSSELLAAIVHLMDNPRETSDMGRSARNLAEGELSWARLARVFADVYRGLIGAET